MTQDDQNGLRRHGDDKHEHLAPLATQVISLLRERQSTTPNGARQFVVDYLVRAIISRNGFDAEQVMDEMRAFRLTLDAIIDLYIPQAAAHLGSLWNSSDLDFASVTVGALRLQALLSEASAEMSYFAPGRQDTLHALVVVPEGEQHFLGASVVAAQLRRMGCDAGLSIAEPIQHVHKRVLHDEPDMVLISCGRLATLESVAQAVKKIKQIADPQPVLAIGGPLRADFGGVKKKTGVDLVTNSAKDVLSFCMKRRKALGLDRR